MVGRAPVRGRGRIFRGCNECARKFQGAREAFFPLLLQRLQDDIATAVITEALGRRRGGPAVHPSCACGDSPEECSFKGYVACRASRKRRFPTSTMFGARVELVAGVCRRLLRRHVGRRAQHRAGQRVRNPLAQLGDAEIHSLDDQFAFIAVCQKNVVGFQVAMNDAQLVGGIEPASGPAEFPPSPSRLRPRPFWPHRARFRLPGTPWRCKACRRRPGRTHKRRRRSNAECESVRNRSWNCGLSRAAVQYFERHVFSHGDLLGQVNSAHSSVPQPPQERKAARDPRAEGPLVSASVITTSRRTPSSAVLNVIRVVLLTNGASFH